MTSHDPDFWEKAGDVCGLYLDPPQNALVWSVDEKTGIQAKSRINPTRPAVPARGEGDDATPAIPVRREFEYRRNGTVKLFAAFNVHEGTVAGRVTDSTRSENFVAFLQDLVDQAPAGMQLHCIVDNLSSPHVSRETGPLPLSVSAHSHTVALETAGLRNRPSTSSTGPRRSTSRPTATAAATAAAMTSLG